MNNTENIVIEKNEHLALNTGYYPNINDKTRVLIG